LSFRSVKRRLANGSPFTAEKMLRRNRATMAVDNGLAAYRRVTVTGGLGFVGRHLVAALAAMGKEVVVVDIAARARRGTVPAGVELRRADLRDREQTERAVADADLVFHLAGNSSGTLSVDRPRFDFETNAQATFNLSEALLGSGARRLVYLSSAMVYGVPRTCPVDEEHPLEPFLPYGASKLSGELAIRSLQQSLGLPAVIARAFTIYGPGEDPRVAGGEVSQFLRWHLNGLPIRATGDVDRKTRDFVHVSDLVAGLLVIADRAEDGQVLNVGSGEEISLRQLAQAIGTATGRQPELVADERVADDTYRMVADVSRLRALGYQPRTPLLQGLAKLARHLGDRPELPSVATIFRSDQRSWRREVAVC
jgi:nucleoside-diphosphate-sugar epimerase